MTLNNSALKKYVGDVYLMEKLKYNQETAIQELTNTIRKLSNTQPLPEPVQAVVPSQKKNKAFKTIALGVVFFLLSSILMEVFSLARSGVGYALSVCMSFAMLGSTIAVIKGFCEIIGNVKIGKENKRIDAQNQKNRDLYLANKREYDKSVQKVHTAKKLAGILQYRLRDLQEELAVIEKDLAHIYSYNIIYPAYRNRAAVASFFEYLSSGRCSSLEGHEGAYNLYNMEARMDHLAEGQDKILLNLNKIEANQRTLVLAVSKSNERLSQVQDAIYSVDNDLQKIASETQVSNAKLEKIAYNAELIQFNSSQIRSEVELRNHVDGIIASHYL